MEKKSTRIKIVRVQEGILNVLVILGYGTVNRKNFQETKDLMISFDRLNEKKIKLKVLKNLEKNVSIESSFLNLFLCLKIK